MLMRYEYLSEHPTVFRSMTALLVSEFNQMVVEVEPPHRPSSVTRKATGYAFLCLLAQRDRAIRAAAT